MPTPVFIRNTSWKLFPLAGTVVGDPVDHPVASRHDRYGVVSYEPVRHHLTPSAYIPATGKPFVVTCFFRDPSRKGFHHSYKSRYKTFEAALKRLAEIAARDD